MTDLLLFAFGLFLCLTAFDFAFWKLRGRRFEAGKPLLMTILAAMRRAGELLPRPRLSLPRIQIGQPASLPAIEAAASTPQTEPAAPALAAQTASAAPITESAPIMEKTVTPDSQNPVPDNGTPAPVSSDKVRIHITADIPKGMLVQINIQAQEEGQPPVVWQQALTPEGVPAKPARASASKTEISTAKALALIPVVGLGQLAQNLRDWLASPNKWNTSGLQRSLFLTAAIIYFLVVSIGIDRFPIYFFTDEAVHTNLAAEFWQRGLRGSDGEFLPTYFGIDPSFALNSVSVYLQVLPYVIFGKSIIVTRMVSAIITLLGAIMVGLLLKQVFKIKSYWLGILLLITSPAWFLHARTAFEYMEVSAFFAAMLYFYNRYRQGEDKYLYATVIAAALVFYTHGLGQVLAGVTALALLIIDFRYHIQPERRRTLFWAFGLALLLFVPYLRYNIGHSTMISAQIRQRGSYWMNDNYTLLGKIGNFLAEYANGLNPGFWFFPNSTDLTRHQMKGLGNLLWIWLPFALWGLVRIFRNLRLPEYRTILVALLAAPIPASIVAIGTPRVLWMIVPWVIIIALGLDAAMHWLEKNLKFKEYATNLALFVILALTSVFMLIYALVSGPTWFPDYGLYGMQYGAKQVFQDTVLPALQEDPNTRFIISPSWANGTDQFASFFIPPEISDRIRFGKPNDLIDEPASLTPDVTFVLTVNEYNDFSQDARFKNLETLQEIPYPDGTPGFYLVKLQFADNIDEIIAAQRAFNRTPIEDTVEINGQIYRVIHSPLGGQLSDIFDARSETLARVIEANPLVFDIYPPEPIETHSVEIQTGSLSNYTVTVDLYAPDAAEPVTYTQTFTGLPPDPQVTLEFTNGPEISARIYITILDNTTGETSQIHVRTIQIK